MLTRRYVSAYTNIKSTAASNLEQKSSVTAIHRRIYNSMSQAKPMSQPPTCGANHLPVVVDHINRFEILSPESFLFSNIPDSEYFNSVINNLIDQNFLNHYLPPNDRPSMPR